MVLLCISISKRKYLVRKVTAECIMIIFERLEMDKSIENKKYIFDIYSFMHNLGVKLLARSYDLLHNYYAHTTLL